MKRATLIARASFLHEKQEQLAKAAQDFAKSEGNSLSHQWERWRDRRALCDAGIAYGLACKRYLGGRSE